MSTELGTKLRQKFITRSFILINSSSIIFLSILLFVLLAYFPIWSHKEIKLTVALVNQKETNGKYQFIYQLSPDVVGKMTEQECHQLTGKKLTTENPFTNSTGSYYYNNNFVYNEESSHCNFTLIYSTEDSSLIPRQYLEIKLLEEETGKNFFTSLLDK